MILAYIMEFSWKKRPKFHQIWTLCVSKNIEGAMSPYHTQQHKSTVCFLFFLVCPWPDPSFWEKDRWCPDTKIESFLCMLGASNRHEEASYASYYASFYPLHDQSMYNKTQNLCLGSTKMCLNLIDTSWSGNGAMGESKKLYSLQ
jgi:hypothetical protein